MNESARALIDAYRLQRHPEGGWFSEEYTSAFLCGNRPLAGSIYFLLEEGDVSHFHRIDCDEIWYFHQGCGMKITVLLDGEARERLLGLDAARGQRPAVVIPAGAVFAAENLDAAGYTFLSCATAPAFQYAGFQLLDQEEIRALCPGAYSQIKRLAFAREEMPRDGQL